jgi:hypothetical protein
MCCHSVRAVCVSCTVVRVVVVVVVVVAAKCSRSETSASASSKGPPTISFADFRDENIIFLPTITLFIPQSTFTWCLHLVKRGGHDTVRDITYNI